MNEKIKQQILAVRDTDLTNMFDIHVVQRIAYDMEFYYVLLERICTYRAFEGGIRLISKKADGTETRYKVIFAADYAVAFIEALCHTKGTWDPAKQKAL